MDTALIYLLLSAAILAIIAACLVFFANIQGSTQSLTRLAGLALAVTLAGLLFGSNVFVGYGLVAVGAIFAIADTCRSARSA